ncbi:hypothetical protein HUW63_02375 [Myxococcus sp. AM001]|uniref:hypothetical protein n=1 Tax=Myxococcus vastator TaxID=2709664 RepID=UPI0013D1B99F|nr:hypothetical protein [Myxococcus vastator]NVJ04090.1 hypothetical protein [Myxococcus sp. AM001]
MAVQYDPNIIRGYAEALYRRASRIVFMAGFIGFVVGAVGGAVVTSAMKYNSTVTLGFVLVGTLIGVNIGRGRAFVLQLQAQSALCQVAIEANTRRAADAAAATPRTAEVAPLAQVG